WSGEDPPPLVLAPAGDDKAEPDVDVATLLHQGVDVAKAFPQPSRGPPFQQLGAVQQAQVRPPAADDPPRDLAQCFLPARGFFATRVCLATRAGSAQAEHAGKKQGRVAAYVQRLFPDVEQASAPRGVRPVRGPRPGTYHLGA